MNVLVVVVSVVVSVDLPSAVGRVDGTATSAPVTSALTIVHEPPSIATGTTVTYEVGQSGSAVLDSGLNSANITTPDSSGYWNGLASGQFGFGR